LNVIDITALYQKSVFCNTTSHQCSHVLLNIEAIVLSLCSICGTVEVAIH